MIVDTHAHYLPQAMLDDLRNRSSDFPSIECMQENDVWKLGFAGGPVSRPIHPNLRKGDTRLQWMDEQKVDVQVCGGWLDSFGYEIPDDEGMRWSQFLNEHLMKNCEASDRLAPLASVPLQNGKMAAKVLEEALKAGFHGVMIGTQPKGGHGNLDDPDLDPFWEAASDLKASVYLHPMFGCGDERMLDYQLLNIIGRGTDTITAVARLIYSGHLLKYSGMNFVLSHGGGGLPFLMGRMRCGQEHNPEYGDPQASLEGCYYDTVVHDSNTLEFVCKQFGADRVMLGSDYPFAVGDLEPCKIVNDTNLTESEKADIFGNVAERIFHLENCGCAGS
ncbi:MAG: amidohydrolase [Rhodospirillaceae bacterium]|jgi:aminocarboxymuconate-semialdehyde decarboxylase|nr:amidohydrolase [Rhodospirillaceae bacterium]MBT5459993.1 amidohydrolase [Rhodospirillaceae bacterium]